MAPADSDKSTTPAAKAISRGPATFAEGWTRGERPRVFSRQDLFNHINGAAELFIELGFEQVIVENYEHGDDKFDLELYEMDAPTAARALFYRVGGDGEALDGVEGRNAGGPYQTVMQKGRYFVQVNNFAGEQHCVPDMVRLANATWEMLPNDAEVPLLNLLPTERRVPGSQRIVRGPYSLQALTYLGKGDVLQLGGETFGVAADYKTSDGHTFTRLLIPYTDAAAAAGAFKYLSANLDSYCERLREDESMLLFKDTQGTYGLIQLDGATLDLRLRMATPPD